MKGRYFAWSIKAGEDLTEPDLYKAVSLYGNIATNGLEAGGVLLHGGKEGEELTLGYHGMMDYIAGEPIKKGARITVIDSGYFGNVYQCSYVVGRGLGDVSSGGLSTGLFNFVNPPRVSAEHTMSNFMGNSGEIG